jgi:hypothetical protein
VLGNEDDVRGRLRVYVTKREHLVVFVDYVRGNVLADDLVETAQERLPLVSRWLHVQMDGYTPLGGGGMKLMHNTAVCNGVVFCLGL